MVQQYRVRCERRGAGRQNMAGQHACCQQGRGQACMHELTA
jgi:hypothetical protein